MADRTDIDWDGVRRKADEEAHARMGCYAVRAVLEARRLGVEDHEIPHVVLPYRDVLWASERIALGLP